MFAPFRWVHAWLLEPVANVRPIDVLFAALLVFALLRGRSRGPTVRPMRRTLFGAIAVTLLALAYGLATGGSSRFAGWQVYLPLATILATFTFAAAANRRRLHRPGQGDSRGRRLSRRHVPDLPLPLHPAGPDRAAAGVRGDSRRHGHLDRRHRLRPRSGSADADDAKPSRRGPRHPPAARRDSVQPAAAGLGEPRRLSGHARLSCSRRARATARIDRVLAVSPRCCCSTSAVGWGRTEGVFRPLRAFQTVSTDEDASTWRATSRTWASSRRRTEGWFLGTGWGHGYVEISSKYQIYMFELWDYVPHNSVLGLFAYTGYVGFVGYWMAFPMAAFLHAGLARRGARPADRLVGDARSHAARRLRRPVVRRHGFLLGGHRVHAGRRASLRRSAYRSRPACGMAPGRCADGTDDPAIHRRREHRDPDGAGPVAAANRAVTVLYITMALLAFVWCMLCLRVYPRYVWPE